MDPEAILEPADAIVLPLEVAPLAPAGEEPLPAEGVVPVELMEVAPVDPPIMLPELMPVSTPVPLIEALHAPHAIGTMMLNAQPHAVLMRKVTFTLLVRNGHARLGAVSYATYR